MADEADIGLGPRLLVIDSILRTLMEHASEGDPTIRDRVRAKVEGYLDHLVADIERYGEIERKFTERARICLEAMMHPRGY